MNMSLPRTIKGYQLLTLLGEGAYGAVYRARQEIVDREVAVKIIRPEHANRPEFIRRFEAEAQLIAQLEHLHIVPLYDYWRDSDGAYLVMRLMKGGSLKDLLEQGALSLPQTTQMIEQIGSALSAAHSRSIVHRDLKPANIMLDEEGNAYLSDFGIAKTLSSDANLTETGAILGTPAYISPEQVQARPISPQTDLYALGFLVYTMLAGQHPFPGTSPGELIARHLRDPMPLLGDVVPHLPPDLDEVLQKATAKDLDARQEDIPGFLAAFHSALGAEPGSRFVHSAETSTRIPPYNLPTELTEFIGRESEIESLQTLFADPTVRLVTVLGVGGMGKTRLALAFAEAQLDAKRKLNGKEAAIYPHGVFFIPLAPLESVDSIIPTIAEILGFRLSEKRDPLNQLTHHLRERQALLILDNFEHLLDGVGLVTELLKTAAGVKILATSRSRLNISGENRFNLRGLEVPTGPSLPKAAVEGCSSVELFDQFARQARAGFRLTDENTPHVVEICRLLGGMPLAIRLAASWIALLSSAEVVGEIQHSLDFLESDGEDVPERHASLRVVMDHSWTRLAEREREILVGLSVFRGGFTLAAARKVTKAALRDLKGLTNKALLNPTFTGRHELHELLRQYVAEKSQDYPNQFSQSNQQHSSYFTAFLGQKEFELKGDRQLEVLLEIDTEIGNIQRAWQFAAEHQYMDQLEQGLESLGLFYLWRRRFREGHHACQVVEECIVAERKDPAENSDGGPNSRFLAKVLTWCSAFCEPGEAQTLVDPRWSCWRNWANRAMKPNGRLPFGAPAISRSTQILINPKPFMSVV